MFHLICGNCPGCLNFQRAFYSSVELIARLPKSLKVTVSARDIVPTPAGVGEANESQSFSQNNETPFSRLKRTNSGSHDLPRTMVFNVFIPWPTFQLRVT